MWVQYREDYEYRLGKAADARNVEGVCQSCMAPCSVEHFQPSLNPGCCVLQNDISEKEQRWGAKTIEGSGRTEHIK